ncbi:hypothetical protein CEXT_135511, partial [Caerostris extrusa]
DKEPGLSQTEIMGSQQNASEEVCGLEINGFSKFRLSLEVEGMFRPGGRDKEPGLSRTEIMGSQQNASEEVCGLEINGVSKFRLGLEEEECFGLRGDKEPGLSQTKRLWAYSRMLRRKSVVLEINGVSKFRLGLEERGMFRPVGVLGVKGFSKQLRIELSFRSSNDKLIAMRIRDCECHLQAM